jgi:hypothetical protein
MTGRAFGARAVGPASRRPTVENFETSPSDEETFEDPGSHRARAGRAEVIERIAALDVSKAEARAKGNSTTASVS